MEKPNFGERTLQDLKQWSKLGGMYFELHPTEKGMMRTRYVRYDPIVGKYIQHAPTNWHYAEPTPEMRPWHDGISRALFTHQPVSNRGFY